MSGKNVLLIVANPDPSSFTSALAERLTRELLGQGATVEIADLAREGFDPRMGVEDQVSYRSGGTPPAAILREQERIDRADAVVLLFPIYWWSLPALLKGWIDRVFTNGWAYGYDADHRVVGKLPGSRFHLVATGAGRAEKYDRYGYRQSFLNQVKRGVFEYCGVTDVDATLLLQVESGDPGIRAEHLATLREVATKVMTNRPAVHDEDQNGLRVAI